MCHSCTLVINNYGELSCFTSQSLLKFHTKFQQTHCSKIEDEDWIKISTWELRCNYIFMYVYFRLCYWSKIFFPFCPGPPPVARLTSCPFDTRLNNKTCFINWNVSATGHGEYVSFPSTLCCVTRVFWFVWVTSWLFFFFSDTRHMIDWQRSYSMLQAG